MVMNARMKLIYYLVFIGITLIVLLPLVIVVFAALKPAAELAAS